MGLGYALTEDFPADEAGRPTAMTLRQLGILRAKDVPPIDVDPRRAPATPGAVRDQGRGRDRAGADGRGRGRRPARPGRRVAGGAADAPERLVVTSDAPTTPGLVCAHHHLYSTLARGMPPPPADADRLHRDPRAGVVAARRRPRPRPGALVGPAGRGRGAGGRAPPPSSTTTPRPSAIDGSLDVIAAACAEVGVRVVCAYEVTDRHGPDGRQGGAGRERAVPPGRRAGTGRAPTPASPCRDDTLDAVAGLAADLGRGRAHPRGRGRRRRRPPPAGLRPLRHRRLAAGPLRPRRAAAAGHDRPQPPVEPEQRRRLRPPGPVGRRRQPGRAGQRRHRRRDGRRVRPGLRGPAGRRRDRHARGGLGAGCRPGPTWCPRCAATR